MRKKPLSYSKLCLALFALSLFLGCFDSEVVNVRLVLPSTEPAFYELRIDKNVGELEKQGDAIEVELKEDTTSVPDLAFFEDWHRVTVVDLEGKAVPVDGFGRKAQPMRVFILSRTENAQMILFGPKEAFDWYYGINEGRYDAKRLNRLFFKRKADSLMSVQQHDE